MFTATDQLINNSWFWQTEKGTWLKRVKRNGRIDQMTKILFFSSHNFADTWNTSINTSVKRNIWARRMNCSKQLTEIEEKVVGQVMAIIQRWLALLHLLLEWIVIITTTRHPTIHLLLVWSQGRSMVTILREPLQVSVTLTASPLSLFLSLSLFLLLSFFLVTFATFLVLSNFHWRKGGRKKSWSVNERNK